MFKLRILLQLVVLLSLGTSLRAGDGYIAIAGAYQPELKAIRKVFYEPGTRIEKKTINGIVFELSEFKGKKILVFPTGMSLTNAAMATQLALDKFPIDAFLFAGIAGGINPHLLPGDVTIPGKWIYHGESAYFNEIGTGKYEVASYFKVHYPNFGMQFPDDVTIIRDGMTTPKRKASFEVDPKLLSIARKSTRTMTPLMAGKRPATLKIGGPGVAGTVFMDNARYREWVWKTWKADCLDMESTAIAQVCWINRKPCLIVRSLSDLAGGQKGLNQIDHFEDVSSTNAALVLRAVVESM